MRLMSYNILTGGRDSGGGDRLPWIVETIQAVSPDILVLNECNGFEQDGFRTLYQLEAALGMRGVLAQAGSGFHVALFHRVGRLLETRFLAREVQHAVLAATLEVGGRTLRVIGAHLCPFGGEARLLEVQHLIRFMREEDVVVLGDLNALSPRDAPAYDPARWLPRRRARHTLPETGGKLDTRAISALEGAELVDVLHQQGHAAPTTLTPIGTDFENYQVRIDYVFASRSVAARVRRAERVSGRHVEVASDHYPVMVELEPHSA